MYNRPVFIREQISLIILPFGDYGKYIRLLLGDGSSVSWDGIFTFLGKTHNRPTREKPYVSFYRQNELGTAWEIEYDIYFPIKSEQLFP